MNRIYCKLVHVVDGQMDEAINLLDQEVKGQPMPPPTADHCSLPAFRRLSEADVRRLVMSSEIKSITPDPVPTFLLREFVDVLPPYVTCVVKSSLRQGRLPDSQKHAVVTPLLKWPGLDIADTHDLEIRVRCRSRSLKMVPFDTSYTTYYGRLS